MTLLERLTAPGSKRMLALDGGGIRGALTAGYLQRIEAILRARHPKRANLVLADYFDLIGGTSTGAIIAAALALGMTADAVTKAYLELGGEGFKKVLLPFKARFNELAVKAQLTKIFGERRLDSEDLRSAICVVAKRADTGSVWPIINHPNGRYFPKNRQILLRDVVRASTAAPTFFIPETLDVGGQRGAFIDGGVSMANNPALQLLMVATLKGFPFHWPMGEDKLLLVSLGTGEWRYERKVEKIEDAFILKWAAEVPELLMTDASWHNQLLLQWLSKSPTAATIDREIGDLRDDLLTPQPVLSYLRYNATLEPQALTDLGLPDLAGKAEDLRDMSDAGNRADLLRVGQAAAKRQVIDAHFPTAFDLAS